MSGCVGHNELAPRGGKETVGHVDGDTLLALSGQAVDQQGKVYVLPLRAVAFGVGLQSSELVVKHLL